MLGWLAGGLAGWLVPELLVILLMHPAFRPGLFLLLSCSPAHFPRLQVQICQTLEKVPEEVGWGAWGGAEPHAACVRPGLVYELCDQEPPSLLFRALPHCWHPCSCALQRFLFMKLAYLDHGGCPIFCCVCLLQLGWEASNYVIAF